MQILFIALKRPLRKIHQLKASNLILILIFFFSLNKSAVADKL